LRVHFDATRIEPVSYRPLDRRFTYNVREYIDFPKPDLQAAWAHLNVALIAKNDGTGLGPGAWAHSMVPDQHSFRGSTGGWVFPLWNHAGEGAGHFLADGVLSGLARAYGQAVSAEQTFDAILALLSATSYTNRFGRDLENDFPHVPFPSELAVFQRAAAIGSRLRALQGLALPGDAFRTARLEGEGGGRTLAVPTPRNAWVQTDDGAGTVRLTSDQALRLTGVSARAWTFSVSGYPVLYKWLKARDGEPIDRTQQRDLLDTVGRIEEIVSLCDSADAVLAEALAGTLGRDRFGLPARRAPAAALEDGDEPA